MIGEEFNLIKISATLDGTQPGGLLISTQPYGLAVETDKSIKFGKTNISKDKFMVASSTTASTVSDMFSQIYCSESNKDEAMKLLKTHLLNQYFTQIETVKNTTLGVKNLISEMKGSPVIISDGMTAEVCGLKEMADKYCFA